MTNSLFKKKSQDNVPSTEHKTYAKATIAVSRPKELLGRFQNSIAGKFSFRIEKKARSENILITSRTYRLQIDIIICHISFNFLRNITQVKVKVKLSLCFS
jgi:hypothetical protein